MIKIDLEIPYITRDDIVDAERLEALLNTFKMYIEELARKAKSVQIDIYNSNPTVNDIEEGEDARTLTREYTKVNGVLKYKSLT